MQDQLLSSSQDQTPQKQSAETVSELVHRHLSDQHHEITDEEIRNVDLQLDNSVPDEIVESAHDVKDKLRRKSASATDDTEAPRITTPADILGS
ncbi:hypothetical protein EXU57_02860 [Segetibacter sp. 3557_3]|uniref:hypothetical protein n=1 Tax=Segetibacter sp. 3557_3 TaxID=2547429 RepID=UPI0010590A7C|nr:hypothetical protein [Segetibacter sp. 3557_3]TDH29030.1 hypothetical protein EXU57_02860 [Segetibacter sp. 3557_3]